MYICNRWYVLYVLVDCQLACQLKRFKNNVLVDRPTESQLKRTTRTICCIYTLLPPDDGQLASPKHAEV
jgi:hypothetical protein